MKKIIALTCIIAFFISSNLSAQGFTKPAKGKAVLYIVNIMHSPGTKSVFTDKEYIGILKSRDYIRYECDPGHHVFLCFYGANKAFFTADVEAGKRYVVRMRTYEKLGGATADFKAFEDLKKDKKKAVLKIVSEKAPNDPTIKLALKMNKSYGKVAKKAFVKYETKLKMKRKYTHISKNMYYTE